MIQQEKKTQYQSPASIRSEVFSHRMRGLDEDEIREYLGELADQVEAMDAEIKDLRNQNRDLRDEMERASTEISPQAVALFSQAQEVADQLVEEAVVHARDLMTSARHQQRDILERAHRAAEEAARNTGGAAAEAAARMPSGGYTTPIPELEYVRTFARVAQVQLRSVLDALTEQVERLGDVPRLESGDVGGFRVEGEPRAFPLPHSHGQPFGGTGDHDDDDGNSIYQQVRTIGRSTE